MGEFMDYKILVNKDNKGIKFDFLGFPSLAIWTKPNAPFVCLEPWIGYADHSDSNYQFIEKKIIYWQKNPLLQKMFLCTQK